MRDERQQSSHSGTHRKTPSVVGAASGEPVLVAEAEEEAPGRRRNSCLSPHKPSGGFQQRRHITCPDTFLVKRFEFFLCGHAPAAASNVQALNPCFGLIPICISIRPCIPFKSRFFVVNNSIGILNKVTLQECVSPG
jgi:hypothetical protein